MNDPIASQGRTVKVHILGGGMKMQFPLRRQGIDKAKEAAVDAVDFFCIFQESHVVKNIVGVRRIGNKYIFPFQKIPINIFYSRGGSTVNESKTFRRHARVKSSA